MEPNNLSELFCTQCSLQFGGKTVYKLHLSLVHNVKGNEQKYQSKLDKIKSENVEDIGENITGKQSFKCEICERKFSFRFSLHRHISEAHEEKRPHKKVNMNNHKESVNEERKKFRCDKCDKAFSDKSNMTQHINAVHEGKRPFQCSICDASFSTKQVMNRHINSVHEGMKPFKCDICKYTFSREGSIKKHIKVVHEGKKPFQCRICFASFSETGSIKEILL